MYVRVHHWLASFNLAPVSCKRWVNGRFPFWRSATIRRKRVELHYLRLCLKDRGDNVTSFVTTISFQDNPCPMIAVLRERRG
jgi:hypothetical protein